LWAKEDEIDVFWGPSHRLPRFLFFKHSWRKLIMSNLNIFCITNYNLRLMMW